MALDAHLVLADSYDRDAYRSATAGLGKELDELLARGSRLVPHFESLLEDLFCALYKLVVQLRPEAAAPRSTALGRAVLKAALAAPGHAALKEETSLDPAKAAAGALALGRRALALLKSGEILLEDELYAAQALAKVEEDLAQKKAALDEAEKADSPLADVLRKQVEQGQEKAEELGEEVERAMEELPQRFTQELSNSAERLGDEIADNEERAESFSRAVGAAGPSDAQARLKLAETLRGSKKLERLAQLAGAFRAEARAARKQRRERAAEELYRVDRGRDLARVLPVELAALRDPVRRADFLRRLVEGELAAYDLRGSDRHGRGPLVVCVDGSGSMSGDRELWSKAVSLALLEIARRQNRRARAIVFSGPEAPLTSFELTGRGRGGRRPVDLEGVIGLAECFPGGGTDFEKPLRAAAEVLRESRFDGGDVVFITDGEAPLRPEFVEELKALKKERDFAVYGIVVDDPKSKNRIVGAAPPSRALDELGKVCDQVTTISRLTAASVRGVFEAL